MFYIVIPILAFVCYFTYCLCVVAKRADEDMERLMAERAEELKNGKNRE